MDFKEFMNLPKFGQKFVCTYIVYRKSMMSIRFSYASKVTDYKPSVSVISHTKNVFPMTCFPTMPLTFIENLFNIAL